MTTFTISTDNTITAFSAFEEDRLARVENLEGSFSSEKELAKLSAAWPMARFAEVWNEFAGVVPFDNLAPVEGFQSRATGITRIWKAIQALTPAPARHVAPVAQKKANATKQATAKDATPTAREGSKKAIVLEMLRRKDGATLEDIMTATGWQPHTVRGFIAGSLKKSGIIVNSIKATNGQRTYSA